MRSVVCTNSFLCSSYYNDPPYLCLSFMVDDTHIVGFASNVLFVFLQLLKKFGTLRLLV
jgi:hypothetical protein